MHAADQDIAERRNVVFCGNSGTGKTHLTIALGIKACLERYIVLFTSVPHLLMQIRECQAQKKSQATGIEILIIFKQTLSLLYLLIYTQNRECLFGKMHFLLFSTEIYLHFREKHIPLHSGKSYTACSLGIPQGLTAARVRRL
jgi:hypothetical protein